MVYQDDGARVVIQAIAVDAFGDLIYAVLQHSCRVGHAEDRTQIGLQIGQPLNRRQASRTCRLHLREQARGAFRHLGPDHGSAARSEEHTSELQSLMRISYAVFCLQKTTKTQYNKHITSNKNTRNKL